MSLIVSFINQTGKPMFIALNFDKYYKKCNKSLTRVIVRGFIFLIIIFKEI